MSHKNKKNGRGAKGLSKEREELKGSITEQEENQEKGEQTADGMRVEQVWTGQQLESRGQNKEAERQMIAKNSSSKKYGLHFTACGGLNLLGLWKVALLGGMTLLE